MDEIKSHAHAYYPVEKDRNTRRFRNIFSSYGSINHLHVFSDGDHLEKRSPVHASKAVSSIKATGPSLPMFPPVDLREYSEEPCFSGAKKANAETEATLIHLARGVHHAGRFNLMKDVSKLTDIEGYNGTRKHVNGLYSGGALAYRKWNAEDPDGVLIYPGGKEMDYLVSVGISEGKNRASVCNKSMLTAGEKKWIYGVDAVAMGDNIVAMTRSIDSIYLFTLIRGRDGVHVKKPMRKERIARGETFVTSVALSPYGLKDYVAMNDAGTCQLRRIDCSGAVDSFQCQHRFESSDHTWHGAWAMHPRQVTVTDRTGVALYDIRRSGHQSASEVFTLPHSMLHTKERVYLCKQYNKSPYYHFIGTSFNLILTDLRFPNHPVLNFNHLLLSPPTCMDIVYDVTKTGLVSCDLGAAADQGARNPVVTELDSHMVLLGCQEHAESHCFPFSPASQQSPPVWLGLPWRISKPSDFSHLSGFCALEPRDGTGERLCAPVVGVAGMSHVHNPGFTCFQMTSYGEIFQQTYNQTRKSKDKTFNAGPGSRDLKLNDVNSKVCCDWLCEAELLSIQKNKVKNSSSVHLLGGAMEDLKALKKKHHKGCMFCKGTSGAESSKGERCRRCRGLVEESQLLYDGLQQFAKTPLPHITAPGDVASADIAERRLRSLNTSNPEDAQSEILRRLWNYQDNIPVELLKRNEQEFIASHPELVKDDIDSKTTADQSTKTAAKSATDDLDAIEEEDDDVIPCDEIDSANQAPDETEETMDLPIESFSLEQLLFQPESYLDTAGEEDNGPESHLAGEQDNDHFVENTQQSDESSNVNDLENDRSHGNSLLRHNGGTSQEPDTVVIAETQDDELSDNDENFMKSLILPGSSFRRRQRSDRASDEPSAKRKETHRDSPGPSHSIAKGLEVIEKPYSFDGSQMVQSQSLFSQDSMSQSQNSLPASQDSAKKKKKSGKKKFLMGF